MDVWEYEKLGNEDFYHLPLDVYRARTTKAFKETFSYHFQNCPIYSQYCKNHGFGPDSINSWEDLGKIPPIPADAFRDSEQMILSVPENDIIKIFTTSSTTSSKPVRYALDEKSLYMSMKFAGRMYGVDGHEMKLGSVFLITPTPEKSDTGLVNVGYNAFKHMGYSDEDIYFTVEDDGSVDYEKVINLMKKVKGPVNLYGPPFTYLGLLEYMEPNGITLNFGEDSRCLTTGGWKGVGGQISKDELRSRVAKAFGVKQENIRDGYGSTDIMSMIPECKLHKKHVPPWLHVSIRDPENIDEEVAEGEVGLIVLMGSHILSYPSFVMPGDMGYAMTVECECGRNSQIVEITGRAKDAGDRGCALRLQEFMTIISNKGRF